jgi:hypothetical protein
MEIGEPTGGEEPVAHVTYGPLDAAFFVAARHRHRAGVVTVVSSEAEQGRMEADRIAASFQNRTFQIVVEQDTRDALPRLKGRDVSAQEVLHAGIEEEAQEDLARVAQHHDERHQRAPRPADFEMSEVSPVDLCLFTGQAAQTEIRLGFRTRSVAGDQVAEVIGATAIAAFVSHDIQPAGGQRREALQGLADERQIGVDLRGARRRPDPRQPGLRQHPSHHAVMDVQLTRDGANGPFLGGVEAQDLCLDVRRRHHVRVPSVGSRYNRSRR